MCRPHSIPSTASVDAWARPPDLTGWKYPLAIIVLAFLLFSVERLGPSLTMDDCVISMMWAPMGISLVAAMFLGYRIWPAILLGSIAQSYNNGSPMILVFFIPPLETVSTLFAVWMLKRWGRFDIKMQRMKDALALIVAGAMFPMALHAGVGTLILMGSYDYDWIEPHMMWLFWWLGNTMGILVVAPVLLACINIFRKRWKVQRILEGAVAFLLLIAVCVYTFGIWINPEISAAFLLFPLFIWIILRLETLGASLAVLATSLVAMIAMSEGSGSFLHHDNPMLGLALLWAFISVLATTTMILSSAIMERKNAEEEARSSLKENEILFRELHHRTKNNMQVISSLLVLQGKDSDDERVKCILDETKNRINSMALIHQKLYQSQTLSRINFAVYIQDLAASLRNNFSVTSDRISFDMNLTPLDVSLNTAIPCGLILNELITNSMKYAFPDNKKGVVRISMHKHENERIELEYMDSGVGFPEEVDHESPNTLGLKLIRMLSEHQLQAELKISNGEGVKYHLVFDHIV